MAAGPSVRHSAVSGVGGSCAFPFVQGELRRYVDENRLTASEKQELQVECRACGECAVFRSEKPFLSVILIPPLSPSGLPRRQPQHGER